MLRSVAVLLILVGSKILLSRESQSVEKKLMLYLAFEEGEGAVCFDSSGNAPKKFSANLVDDMYHVNRVQGKQASSQDMEESQRMRKNNTGMLPLLFQI